ncbi:hypothetical protein Glove_114g199 [Diversispora epigaea]|uniref:Uncharacterized protein n=1 Tax=Diversispora epigaea TaxID=1348612 RepID=A0A397J1D0_9GLOM|nr:hypothetical protein Glove_114g199 [Diversispora epigaea]
MLQFDNIAIFNKEITLTRSRKISIRKLLQQEITPTDKFERQFDKPYKLIKHVNDRAFNEAFKDNKDDLINFLKLLTVYYEKKQDIYKEIRLEFLKKNFERSAEFCKWKNDIFDMSQRNVDIDTYKFRRKLDDLEYDI